VEEQEAIMEVATTTKIMDNKRKQVIQTIQNKNNKIRKKIRMF